MTTATTSERISQRKILFFWAPLAATWLMMGVEGPYLAAIIARLPDPKFNLAAHGVAYAFALLVEAPVIMLMSATTALVSDAASFRKLRNFMRALGLGTTALLLVVLVPPVHRWLMREVVGLPAEVADLTYGALWLFLPWPGAIGYRRFLQGVMIKAGRTRLVAYGTVIRVLAMSAAALVGFLLLDVPGAWVGALALSTGVVAEAAAARWMAGSSVRDLFDAEARADTPPAELSYREIAGFYYPLALTSLIGLTVQPMLTFFMGRAAQPVDSLAVFPVVQSLSFIFRSVGLAFQDTAIALMGDRHQHLAELERFGTALGLTASAGIFLVAYTPLAGFWFGTLSGLSPELTAVALTPSRVIFALPALTVLLAVQRAILVTARRTRPITMATAIEVVSIGVSFAALGWGLRVVGVTAAFIAFVVGRLGANGFLAVRCRRVLRGSVASTAAA
jgi:Na+-driven multidrug efflux pump